MPLISILVTVYNLENYISKCLDSILLQDFDDYELIVVDNGSNDKSISICQEYERKHPEKIIFFSLPTPTISGRAHIKAILEAKGEYIQYVDGDDYLAANSLKEIAKILKDKKPDVFLGTFECVLEQGATNLKDAVFDGDYINNSCYDSVLRYLSTLPNFHPLPWRFIFNKRIGQKIDNYDKRDLSLEYRLSTNDWLAMARLLSLAESIVYYTTPFYFYRRRPTDSQTSLGSTNNMSNYITTFIVILRDIMRLKLKGARFDFVISRLRLLLNNFIVAIDKITLNDFKIVFSMIEKNILYFEMLKDCGDDQLELLYSYISKYGSKEGLMLFCEYDKIKFMSNLPNIADKEIYIFPTGIKGQATARILKSSGIRVNGFLDNDSTKWGGIFEELPCYAPDIVKEYELNNSENLIVIIATLYDYLKPILKDQLIKLSLKQDNIILRN